jgi:gamma-glutamyltranspeptidase/glutathione hydrolase
VTIDPGLSVTMRAVRRHLLRFRNPSMLKPRSIVRACAFLCLAALVAGCRQAPQREAPANASRVEWTAGVTAAHPYAVDAGLAVLRAGGNAIDAAVAVQAMLGLVVPESCGLGGGGFLLYYDAATGTTTAFDGREEAPAGATADMFLGADGEPLSYVEAVVSGRAIGTPGAIAMLGLAHERFGRLPWNALFNASIERAEEGFRVSGRLARYLTLDWLPQLKSPDVKSLFSRPDGSWATQGDTLRNSAYADSLRRIAETGPRALFEDPIASQIVARAGAEPRPGTLSEADLARYEPRSGEPVCDRYRSYTVCVPPPPSSGVSLLQMLAILDRTDIAERSADDPKAWFLFAEAARLMYADRDRYIADPAFVDVPVAELLDPQYVARRAALIGERAGPAPSAGMLAGYERGIDRTREVPGTSHFVVIDAGGNVASMTTSVESVFGTGRTVGGFFLNNQLTDFSFVAREDGSLVANAVQGGKRPRSSMSPVLVFDADDRFVAALGSPGGSAILVYNAKALVGLLAWGLTLEEAIDLPNVYARGDSYFGELDRFAPGVIEGLATYGVELKAARSEQAGVHGIVVTADHTVTGAADPRREGEWRTVDRASTVAR